MARAAGRRAKPRDEEESVLLSASRTVVLVSPDPRRAGEIVEALQADGLPSVQASTAAQAIFWVRRLPPAHVLLDLHMRGANVLLGELRAKGLRVVALGDDPHHRVRALEAGCLDALPRSVEPDELAARIVRLTRSDQIERRGTLVAGPLTIDLSACRLLWRDEEVSVSPLLLDLAAYLAAREGRLTPARILLQDVWAEPWGDPNKVHQAVHRLRRRLEVRANSGFLVAKRGHGYGLFAEQAQGAGRTPVIRNAGATSA
jgi:DNA-binding response OmpR family regulator